MHRAVIDMVMNWLLLTAQHIQIQVVGLVTQSLKRHGPFVAFHFYCKIMLYGISYTYYSVKKVKICFHVPFKG